MHAVEFDGILVCWHDQRFLIAWIMQIQRPMVLAGVSLGSAVAVQFALQHPEAVAGLVLSAPQVYVDGIGPMASLPRVLAYLGVQVHLPGVSTFAALATLVVRLISAR